MRRLLVAFLVVIAAVEPAAAQVINAESVRGVSSTGSILGPRHYFGTGDPEGAQVAAPGSTFSSTNGYLYWKAAGTGTDNSGWLKVLVCQASGNRVFFSASGDCSTNAALSFDPNTGTLSATIFSGSLAFSNLTSTTNAVTNSIFRQSGALSLVGRSANSTGNVADIQATAGSDCVFRESSSTLGCGKVALAGIANATANDKLLGSGNSGSGSPYTQITVGSGLTMTGTTLSASGGGGGGGTPGGSDTQVQFNDGGSLGGDSGFTFNKTTDAATLAGVFSAAGYFEALSTKTSNYTATAADSTILCDATSGAVTITLPAVSGLTGRVYTMIKIDSSTNACTFDGNASETISGATTVSTTVQYTSYSIIANGSAWYIK